LSPAESYLKEVGFVELILELVTFFGRAGW